MSIPKPEHPRPDFERNQWLNLNGDWDFQLFPAGMEDAERAFATSRLGYEGKIIVPFSWVCPLSGVEQNVAGIGWYRRSVAFESAGRVFLCFGAVDYVCDVYINGAHAGHHQGGYTQFEIDATPHWRKGDNVIEVRAEDYRRETQTYGKQGYGEIQGIWQTVWLEGRPESYIESFRFITKCTGEITLSAKVTAPEGASLTARFDGAAHSAPVKNGQVLMTFRVDNPKLWSPDSPYLYEGALELEGGDTLSTYFGIREIAALTAPGKDFKWVMLNGEPVYLNGTLDQAFNPKGHFTYPSDQDMRDEAWRLKRLGLNMVRIHIKPEEPRKLYWMDKLGVLVMEDIPCFWGEPNEEARAAYEAEWPDTIARDINHPSTFAWVMFNETWGLLSRQGEDKVYLPETQDWVRDVYQRARAMDETRLVEDNSVCRYDHVETDINTWHFYLNTYEVVRDHIREVVAKTHPGSQFNYTGGNAQSDAPLMNSECGMVWGVDGSAGDSDLAWQYHYMLNEYRLHDQICGFVFTEFHDVVNEFNGYYRIDDRDKDFGYQHFCRGMTLRDLHAQDFVATDCPPCQTVDGGERVNIPLVLSSFTAARHGRPMSLRYELWQDTLEGRVTLDTGVRAIQRVRFGANPLGDLEVTMPQDDAMAVLSLYLEDEAGDVISRNFVTFDVRARAPRADQVSTPVCEARGSGFEIMWNALAGQKACFGGSGDVSVDIDVSALPADVSGLTLCFEAGAKRVLGKDRKQLGEQERDLGFMRGYLVDRGMFENSYFMTDEDAFPTDFEVLIDDAPVKRVHVGNDYADAAGVLSWHYQPEVRRLDEAGSYGELIRVEVPSRLIPSIMREGKLRLTLRVTGGGGLALYGRSAGRYPLDILLRAW